MSLSSIHRGRGSGAGMLLALLGLLALAPGAMAHCGSRVTTAASVSGDPSAGLEVVALAAESPSPLAPGTSPVCDGPSCSRRDPTPLPGRGSESPLIRGDGMASDAPAAPSPSSSRRIRIVDETLDDPRAPSGVFHPPRHRS